METKVNITKTRGKLNEIAKLNALLTYFIRHAWFLSKTAEIRDIDQTFDKLSLAFNSKWHNNKLFQYHPRPLH